MKIFTFDTTLREGTQGQSILFSVEDKLLITEKLDELGIDYIEGGWPASNPKDKEFFERAKSVRLKHAKLTAFGATRFVKRSIEADQNIADLLAARTPAVSIFGSCWNLHVERVLDLSAEENFQLIAHTVSYVKAHGREVIYDAEHFFDGYNANPAFALRTLEAAKKAGADVLCLCDTSGGTLPARLSEIVQDVRSRFDGVLGIHCHNDADVAVANTLLAVEAGVTHVQGCINGYGERSGSANLCSILANLELKLGHTTIGPENLKYLTNVARFVAELANLPLRHEQPFVGSSAFAQKGGPHAALKEPGAYQHIQPETVGNKQRIVLSDVSGTGNLAHALEQLGLKEHLTEKAGRELLQRIKIMEQEGYDFEAAEGTLELLVREAAHPEFHPFEVVSYEVSTRLQSGLYGKLPGNDETLSTANVTLRIGDNVHSHAASGQGPIHALDLCLRQCLGSVYPAITSVRLTDYKVRVLGATGGTESKGRVLIEWSDHRRSWNTVGVSNNVIDASWRALVDALRLELVRLLDNEPAEHMTRDSSWAV